MARKKMSKLTAALLEVAADQHRIGVMDDETYRTILVRHLGNASVLAKSNSVRKARTNSPKKDWKRHGIRKGNSPAT